MPTRSKITAHVPAKGAGVPKSFAPQPRGPLNVSAWDQLENIANPEASVGEIDAKSLVALARRSIEVRRMRRRHLPAAMFGEPAWEMLLSLYVLSTSGAHPTVSSLSAASGSPPSTALRWIDYLKVHDFVTRQSCPSDRRMVFIELTDTARASIEAYLRDLYVERLARLKS